MTNPAAYPLENGESLVWCALCASVLVDDPRHYTVTAHYLWLHRDDLPRLEVPVGPSPGTVTPG